MVEFSLVCPIKSEINLIPATLPSFYSVGPSEVILCLDKPAPTKLLEMIKRVSRHCFGQNITRILEVEKNPGYSYHQAWVRRRGFHEARFPRVLTADIDLVLNRNVLKAVAVVGKGNIGLVSLSKLRYPNSVIRFLRLYGASITSRYVHYFAKAYRGGRLSATSFTGLYAFWKDYWLDSEPEEELRKLKSSKAPLEWDFEVIKATGEDTFLRDHMEKKHKVVYLPDIGGLVLTDPMEDLPVVQFKKGVYFSLRGRNLLGALAHTFLRLQPHYLLGHLYGERMKSLRTSKRLFGS